MADGKGTRWENYMNTTKQTIDILGENLLERTIRILNSFGIFDIKISSHDYRHNVSGIKMIQSSIIEKIPRMFVFDFLNDETVFLYGDTYYSFDCLKQIIETETDDVMFFGNENAIIGIKVVNYVLFKEKLRNYDDSQFTIYHAFDDLTDQASRFFYIKSSFYNINTSDDYKKLIRKLSKQ